MNDLISREDALTALNGACSNWQDDSKVADIINGLPPAKVTGDLISRADAINAFWEDSDIRTAEVRATLKALPSADAVQGEWHQISPARIYECSICNHNVLTDYIDTYNYCPSCGARMKGGEKK